MAHPLVEQDYKSAREIEDVGERARHDVRKHERRMLAVAVTFESDNNFYTGITNDIGEGGIFVSAETQPAVGTELTIVLSVEGDFRPLHVRAVVRWVRSSMTCGWGVRPGFGAQFCELAPETLEAITRFMNQRDTLFFEV